MRNAAQFSTSADEVFDALDLLEDRQDVHAGNEERRGDGALGTARPRARRGYSLLKGRRTRFQSKRRTGKLTAGTPVHRGEREIIARN